MLDGEATEDDVLDDGATEDSAVEPEEAGWLLKTQHWSAKTLAWCQKYQSRLSYCRKLATRMVWACPRDDLRVVLLVELISTLLGSELV